MRFRNLEENDYPQFLELYNSSFPDNERRLYKSAEHLANFIKEKGGKFNGFVAGESRDNHEMEDSFLGFLTYWIFDGYIYVEHFAVKQEFRGKHIGQKMLQHLFTTIGCNVLIEVEKPDTRMAGRRIAFYERNGFKLHEDIHYVQPAYSAGQNGVEMMLMTHGDVPLRGKCDLRELYAEVYNVEPGV